MQNTYQFISDKGVFSLPGAADYSDLYFPVAGECGIKSAVTPTMSFDERGHRPNGTTYFGCGYDEVGEAPEDFYPTVQDFIGEGGNFERPEAVVKNFAGVPAGKCICRM